MAALLDPVTCFAIVALMTLMNGGILVLVHRDLPETIRPSALDWLMSTLLMAGGSLFLVLQAYAPPAFILPLANGLLMLGLTGYWRALRRFYGKADSPWLIAPTLAGTLGIYWFADQQPHLTARVVLSAAVWLVILVGAIGTLRNAAEDAKSRRVLTAIFVVVASFTLVRAVYFAVRPAQTGTVTDRSLINLLTPIVVGILPLIGTTTFLLLCSDRIRRQWERAASTDYLTGLANRRTLGFEGNRRVERARANGDQLAIAVVDVDHFKSFNDHHGHEIGDLALKHVSSRLKAACRGGDLPARQGGEEFVVLFDRIDALQAKTASERMRLAVESEPFLVDGSPQAITVSIGVAALSPTDETFDDLLRRGDQALYAAKTGGRNRVELAE
ncbi:MAG: GGDEF domain-containing protein [Myxococcales bacterium]|nr:GGDEF domain-containing protein [Myxococcales bacterium]